MGFRDLEGKFFHFRMIYLEAALSAAGLAIVICTWLLMGAPEGYMPLNAELSNFRSEQKLKALSIFTTLVGSIALAAMGVLFSRIEQVYNWNLVPFVLNGMILVT